MTHKKDHKPIIETIINTAALAIVSYGVIQITTGNSWGYIAVAFGMTLEFFKYWGRKQEFW